MAPKSFSYALQGPRTALARAGRIGHHRSDRVAGWLDTTNADYRQILHAFQFYDRALETNLPFPKTRRIVFLDNRPATLPGWAELSIEG